MRVDELPHLNSEMLNSKTYPYFIDALTADNIIEVDTPEELEIWKNKSQK